MLIVDAHLDLAWNALQWNRNLFESVYTTRILERTNPEKGRALSTVALPEMRRGRVAISFVTLLARATGVPFPHLDFASPAQAYGVAQGQLAFYRALERQGHARLIGDGSSLASHIQEWEAWEAGGEFEEAPLLGFVLSMESADPILDPGDLEDWWNAGLRLLGPAHYGPGRYAGGTGTELGLTAAGHLLLAEMERIGMLLDVTHLSDVAFRQALERYHGPILASHSNARRLVPHQRQLSDEQLRAIFARDGVVGVAFDAWMLESGWIVGASSNARVTLDTVLDHIDYVCQLAGTSRHVGIGSDLDGGFGREQSPNDLDTIADLQRIPERLAARGYTGADIAAIMHGNWLRFLHDSWK